MSFPRASSSHMMKTTRRGRPFVKDTLDLFATLAVSLQFTPHRVLFRSIPNSFTTDEAALSLASIKFSQSNRGPDPRDSSRVITTTTTTTFSMTRDMAKAMSQHFMDARLIENAADPSSNLFKNRGVYVLTAKGLHVLDRFVNRNGINAGHLSHLFATRFICMKLFHIERRSIDDEIIASHSAIVALFRRFVGPQANYPPTNIKSFDSDRAYHERSKGIQLRESTERLADRASTYHRHCFMALAALEWLCDFTSVVGREEAAEMAAQFVRFGLITLVSDKRKKNDKAIIFTVRGPVPNGNSLVQQTGEFRCTAKAVYKITDEGFRVAHWDSSSFARSSTRTSLSNITKRSSVDESAGETDSSRRTSPMDKTDAQGLDLAEGLTSERLRFIIDQPQVRQLFRDFLRHNLCEKNLGFWIEVEDLKRKFSITSSVSSALAPVNPGVSKSSPGHVAMEQHHDALIQQAFNIYRTYLAPGSECELDIDRGLRYEFFAYLAEVLQSLVGGAPSQKPLEAEQLTSFNATQLLTMIKFYERIQMHVFGLMEDWVPKFLRTSQFAGLRVKNDLLDSDVCYVSDSKRRNQLVPTHDGVEVGGAYITVSQRVG